MSLCYCGNIQQEMVQEKKFSGKRATVIISDFPALLCTSCGNKQFRVNDKLVAEKYASEMDLGTKNVSFEEVKKHVQIS